MVIRLLIAVLLFASSAYADPVITSVDSSTVSHNGTLIIYDTNEGFSTKSPAAPLWWDNMEGASNESTTFTSGELSWVISGVLSGTDKHYSEALPTSALEPSARMTYRSVNYRSVAGPHSQSSVYATGAHWQFEDNDPPYSDGTYDDVGLTVDSGTADKNIWFVHYYYRIDPSWAYLNDYENHKKSVVNIGTTMYDGDNNCYMVSQGLSDAKVSGDGVGYRMDNIIGIVGDGCARTEVNTGANAKDSWVAIEQIWDSPGGQHEIWTWDGGETGSGRKDYSDSSDADCADVKNNTRSFSVGGWYCTNATSPESAKRGGQDNFRYYDDLYVDNTFSRVVLANDSTYADATIVEPQIPSAWAVGEITVTVNQGSLPNGTAYLFVFDSDNVANDTGYPITLSDQYPPTISGCVFK